MSTSAQVTPPATRDPLTPRGERTRSTLIAAARRVFEKRGYVDTKLSHITREARCSTGTFYTYFVDKADILRTVLDLVQDDMMHPSVPAPCDTSMRARIEASNRAYLESYRRNAKMMRLLDQVAAIDPEFREVRTRRSAAFIERNARSVAALQAAGLADADLDPHITSKALSAMVSRTAFHVFCVEDGQTDLDELVAALTRLWLNALRVPS